MIAAGVVPNPAVPRSIQVAVKARGVMSVAGYVLQKYDILERSRAELLAGEFVCEADIDEAERIVAFDELAFDELALACAIGLLRAECGYSSPPVPKEQQS